MKSLAALAVVAIPSILLAQSPGQKIAVKVQAASVVTRGDTTGISTVVTNLSGSLESLVRFAIDAPAGVVTIATPSPEADWLTFPDFRSRPMAFWGILALVAPGSATPPLYFESVGLPGILDYWAGGKYQLPSENDVSDSSVIPDPFVTAMISGKTVGVEPYPSDRSSQALLSRLYNLTQTVCGASSGWITDSSVCGDLTDHMTQAEVHRAAGQTTLAAASVDDFTALLTAGQASGTVSPSAYWLLKVNAEIIRPIL